MRQRLEVWLGPTGLLWAQPAYVGPNSKTFADTFTRADDSLGGSTSSDGLFSWLEVDGTSWVIASNQAACPNFNEFATARADADLDTDDHYAEFTIATYTLSAGDLNIGPIVRWTSGADGCACEVGTGARRIYRYDNDATIVSDAGTTTSGTVRLEVDGSTLTAKVDGATILGPTTNTAFTGQLRTGIAAFSTVDSNSIAIDSFGAGDLVLAETITIDKWQPHSTPYHRQTWTAVPSGTTGIKG